MEPSFPVLTKLSRSLDIRAKGDYMELLRWIFCLASFVEETGRIARASTKPATVEKVVLRLDDKFFKPIFADLKPKRGSTNIPHSSRSYGYYSDIGQSVDYIMQIYCNIADVDESRDYVLFPEGLMMLPNEGREVHQQHRASLIRSMKRFNFTKYPTNTPIIVYPLLSEEYSYLRPPEELVAGYLSSVKSAIRILNEANVCHGDLRPRNILWRRNRSDGIDIQVIDFEDSGLFGHPIKFHRDSRFPHSELPEGSLILASAVHNEWFYKLLFYWLSVSERLGGVRSEGSLEPHDVGGNTVTSF